MNTSRILVVEDDPQIGPKVAAGLQRAGYDTTLATDGPTARAAVAKHSWDLVILDLMLPGEDGFSLLTAWKDRNSVPVIVLTAQTSLDDRLRSFSLGAMDWLPKPFFMEELVARVRTRLGHTAPKPQAHRLVIGDCELDLDRRSVFRDQVALSLTTHEINLLVVLVSHPDRAFTRDQLANRALPADGNRERRTVDSHISRIRKKLGADGERIHTVFGVGYRYDSA
ncbi:MAG: response regulator [Rhodobacterales bacterium]|nr:response regulator [Rhodobacterales bacterium]